MLDTVRNRVSYRISNYRDKIAFHWDLWRFCKNKKINMKKWGGEHKRDYIPKIIHYCWFGRGKYSSLIEQCMASWQRFLPAYEFVLWNEDNFPIEQYPFAAEAYEKKKYAFVSDVARLHALYEHGGIYLDTDIEVLKSFDSFLQHGAFSGFETYGDPTSPLQSGVMGAKSRHPWIALLLSWYEGKHFDGYATYVPNTRIITKITKCCYPVQLTGEQLVVNGDVHLYPAVYFCPGAHVSEQSCCIHHFVGSWIKS